MRHELTPAGKLTVYYTPAEREALGLPSNRTHQHMTNHWKDAVLWLLEKGVPLEKGLKWLRRGSGGQSFWRVVIVARRYSRGTCYSPLKHHVDMICGSYRSSVFGGAS